MGNYFLNSKKHHYDMHTLYIRTLKQANHTVFAVADGQKSYYDPVFNRKQPFSGGQQVKRCLLEEVNNQLNTPGSPTTFVFSVKKGEMKEDEVYGTCRPDHVDQLLGGWMHAAKGGKSRTIKRRSPLSISAMYPLHPKLARIDSENITFDRSNRSNNKVIVRDAKGNEMTEDQIAEALEGKDRSLSRKWIPGNDRAYGIFVQDIAIDLRRLFTVSLNKLEPEITDATEQELRDSGWEEIDTIYGRSLIAPASYRQKVIDALAAAIIDWRITSNQSRTFSLMQTLAIGVSPSARNIGSALRAEQDTDDEGRPQVNVVVEEDMSNVETFVTPVAKGYLYANGYNKHALDNAEAHIKKLLSEYDYSGLAVSA